MVDLINSERYIRLSKSCIGEAEKNAVKGVLDREFLGMGKEVNEFEEELSSFFGRTTICVANGTAALHLALQACGIGNGDEVLVQSLTYVASFQAISATGATPIACDIEPSTLTIDLQDAERRLTKRTKAIMPVHYSGGVGELDKIYMFAKKNGIRVIEDAAHSFGTVYQGKRVGSIGDISCFSFDGIKNITSGEGGCIVCDDTDILNMMKDARLLGIEKDTQRRYKQQRSWQFEVKAQGWRYHMSNIMAAIGLEQMKRFTELSLRRQGIARQYEIGISNFKNLKTLNNNYHEVVPHIYPLILGEELNREMIQTKLTEYGIQTGIHYQPNHNLILYKDDYSELLPVTERIAPYLLSLPMHPELSGNDIEYIINALDDIIN